MSYFGSWQTPQPDVLALVPWADMLSHSSEAGQESCLRYNSELAAVTLSAHRDYQPGAVVDALVQDWKARVMEPSDSKAIVVAEIQRTDAFVDRASHCIAALLKLC